MVSGLGSNFQNNLCKRHSLETQTSKDGALLTKLSWEVWLQREDISEQPMAPTFAEGPLCPRGTGRWREVM
jgi:hypothetical protein